MTGDSYNLVGSNILPILQAKGRRSRVLVIGGAPLSDMYNNSLSRAWINRSRPLGGIRGFSSSGFTPSSPATANTPFTKTDASPANLSKGVFLHAFHHDQPNAPGESLGKFFDTGATAGDGTSGLDSVTLNGGHEYMWAQAANVAADAQILTCALGAGYDPLTTPNWYQRALTIKALLQNPAPDATGVNPIVGGPSLKLGLRRGAAAFTLGAASTAPTSLSLTALSGTLAAGAGRPELSLNNGATVANRKTRVIPYIYHLENDADEGLSLVFQSNYDTGSDGWSGLSTSINHGFWDTLNTLMGGFDAVIFHCGDFLPDGTGATGFGQWVNLFNELATGTCDDTTESHSDGVNEYRMKFGSIPILFISSWYAGQGSTNQERNLIRESFNDAMLGICSPDKLEKDGQKGNHGFLRYSQPNCSFINLYPVGNIARCSQTGGGQICTDPAGGDFTPNSAGSDLFMDTIWSIIERAQNASHRGLNPRTHRLLRSRHIK